MRLSDIARHVRAAKTVSKSCRKGSCQSCKACLAEGEKWVCSKCRAEIKAYLGDSYRDPNGPQWYASIMQRLPLVRFSPYSW